ncbi:MAG: hypothetical protein CFE45_17860 [Burkholderiales bacterium PBB5]|nr:MAG: hypothetical protein CFE45_17860 [Burkholderiales bacterium PBB5]
MKLYYSTGSCSLSPRIALHEAGLAHEGVLAPTKTKVLPDGSDFRAINPQGYVPTGERLTEGAAIVQYIADQVPASGLAPAAGTMERYRLQEWLTFISSELHKSFGTFFNPAANDDFKASMRDRLAQRLRYVDEQLEGKTWLMGDTFTVADGYLFNITAWAKPTGFDMAHARKVRAAPQIAYLHGGPGLLPSYVPAWTMLQAMLHTTEQAEYRAIVTVDDVRVLAKGVPAGTPIRVALDDLLAAGDSSLADFRRRFEAWFTLFEDQLGAWYRQRTQLVVGAISLAVVATLNVDTLSLVNQLATTPQLREAMVQQAEKAVAPAPTASEPLTPAQLTLAMKQVRQAADQFNASGLRVGWTQDEFRQLRQSHTAKVHKLVGLLLSALAIALGAPFWFDLLKGLISVRAVGKSLTEKQDDAAAKAG